MSEQGLIIVTEVPLEDRVPTILKASKITTSGPARIREATALCRSVRQYLKSQRSSSEREGLSLADQLEFALLNDYAALEIADLSTLEKRFGNSGLSSDTSQIARELARWLELEQPEIHKLWQKDIEKMEKR